MKANELMIGDYVKFLGRVRKIKSIISKDTGIEISFEGKNPVVVSLDEIELIPSPKAALVYETRVKINWRSAYGEWEQGDTGVVDGYCRGGNDVPYAIVILDKNSRFVMVSLDQLERIG